MAASRESWRPASLLDSPLATRTQRAICNLRRCRSTPQPYSIWLRLRLFGHIWRQYGRRWHGSLSNYRGRIRPRPQLGYREMLSAQTSQSTRLSISAATRERNPSQAEAQVANMRRETANANAEDRPDRELLERMAVRLIVIAEECTDPATQLKLRQLVDQLHSSFLRLDRAYAELNIVQDFIPVGCSNRPGERLVPTAITIHNTDNVELGANAAAHAQYQKSADARKREVSWHFTVDDKNVYQSLPINEIGWHTGAKKGNATSIGVAICMNADPVCNLLVRRPSAVKSVTSRSRAESRLNVCARSACVCCCCSVGSFTIAAGK